jgi:hypothetical protein
LAVTRLPENTGNLDPVSKFVEVRKDEAAVALQVFSVGNIVAYAHVNAEIFNTGRSTLGPNQ